MLRIYKRTNIKLHACWILDFKRDIMHLLQKCNKTFLKWECFLSSKLLGNYFEPPVCEQGLHPIPCYPKKNVYIFGCLVWVLTFYFPNFDEKVFRFSTRWKFLAWIPTVCGSVYWRSARGPWLCSLLQGPRRHRTLTLPSPRCILATKTDDPLETAENGKYHVPWN